MTQTTLTRTDTSTLRYLAHMGGMLITSSSRAPLASLRRLRRAGLAEYRSVVRNAIGFTGPGWAITPDGRAYMRAHATGDTLARETVRARGRRLLAIEGR